jgi:hypothetical protein
MAIACRGKSKDPWISRHSTASGVPVATLIRFKHSSQHRKGNAQRSVAKAGCPCVGSLALALTLHRRWDPRAQDSVVKPSQRNVFPRIPKWPKMTFTHQRDSAKEEPFASHLRGCARCRVLAVRWKRQHVWTAQHRSNSFWKLVLDF